MLTASPDGPESLGNTWVEITIPLTCVTATIVGLRLWWRFRLTGNVGKADISISISLFLAILQAVIGSIGILKWGFGHHVAYLGGEMTRGALEYFYLYQIPYKMTVCTTKMSFVFLYLDIFPNPKFQTVCHAVNGMIVAAMIAFTLGTVFQCTPIPYNWDKRIQGGHCFNALAFWYGHAAWNTATDILVLLMPIPVIRSLQMGRNQKAALMGVFALGAFVCVVDSTGQAFIWTQVETCVGIICACLPTLKAPISRFIPNIFSGKWSSSARTDPYNLEEGVTKKRPWRGVLSKNNSIYRSREVKGKSESGSSREKIMGITKTVDVKVTHLDPAEDMPPNAKTFFLD